MTKRTSTSQRCVHCIVSGRVQGVFYRAKTQALAKKLGVTGWVRNNEDGTVELIAVGKTSAIDELLQWLPKGPPLAKVEDVFTEEYPLESFDDFIVDRDK